jgi:hypothetical protein
VDIEWINSFPASDWGQVLLIFFIFKCQKDESLKANFNQEKFVDTKATIRRNK